MRVLLIDDAAVLRAAFARIARSLGVEITPVDGLTGGLRAATSGSFDAIVVDGRLPGDALPGSIGALRAAAPRSAVFVIASLEERALVREASAAGASGAILRPFRKSQIRDAFAAFAPR